VGSVEFCGVALIARALLVTPSTLPQGIVRAKGTGSRDRDSIRGADAQQEPERQFLQARIRQLK